MNAWTRMNFVDVHAHIIPGIDDGPATIGEVLQMLHAAYQGGTREIVATPHMFLDPYNNNDLLKVNDCFARTIGKLKIHSESPEFAFLEEMTFYLGSENYASPEFLEALEQRSVLPLNGSRYLLVEYPPLLSFDKFLMVLNRIFEAGLVPVIAHVERNFAIQEKPARMARLLEMGCVSQVNADSILGRTGSPVRKSCDFLLRNDLVHLIASDGHGMTRPLELEGTFLRLHKKYPPERVCAWMAGNPSLILRDKPLPFAEAGFAHQQ